ncbi:A/G-specific adenine glycosylase [Candidatus Woesebacteria bacterium]|nr:A/G-specific adenine glycosylase [Candidatus Woesebacteria bacterium]
MKFFAFQNYIRNWYRLYGRHTLPWRLTTDPYHILVSELMLQQTQVERVIPKYLAFLKQFPTVEALSLAKLSDVLIAWQGLGYNRRAKYLWQTAKQIADGGGVFPSTARELMLLPGIGPYTAAAVTCFSFNQNTTLIETNVRTVFLCHFFPAKEKVGDSELIPLIAQSIDENSPREWYWALMDYGSFLKKNMPNPNRASHQYNKQSPFAGSRRQVRGEIIRLLSDKSSMTITDLHKTIQSNPEYLEVALKSLIEEGFVRDVRGSYQLSEDSR